MKLISIELKNFRQFYGKQTLDFSTDALKNVTLIHGENNGGKTALLNSMRWCLYEELTKNLLDKKDLLNKHAKAKGELSFHVFIQLIHEGKIYEVRRFMKNTGRVELRVYLIENGQYAEQAQPQYFINTILPKEMSGFFFYQGEGEGTLNSANDFKYVTKSVEEVLGFTVATKTVKHLKAANTKYQKMLRELDTSGESTRLLKQKESLDNRLESDIKAIDDFENKEVELNKKLDELTKIILSSDVDSVKKKAKERDIAENSFNRIQQEKKKLLANKDIKLASWATNAYTKNLEILPLDEINTEELKEKLKYSVDRKLIEEIFNNASCICGSQVHEGTDAHAILSSISKYSVDPELKVRWKRTLDLHQQIKGQSDKTFTQMREYLNNISQCERDEEAQKDIVNELSAQLKNINIGDLSQKEEQRDSLKSELTFVVQQLAKKKHSVQQDKLDILDIDEKLHRFSMSKPQLVKAENLIFATTKVLDLFNTELSAASEGVDDILLKKMKDFFAKVAFNGYTAAKDGRGAWRIVDANNHPVAAGNGYQAMLAISFIVALIEFAKDRSSSSRYLLTPGTVAPFIADSILAFIGPDNGRELVKFIACSVEQCVFMFSQAQWTESHTDIGIRERIGKEYNLVQHTVLTEEEFKGQYPTHLTVGNKHYDVVRFGSEFDKVTIEEVA
ncbi:hypothetical protein BCT86_00830 [Vibrio breoganii]|uniref:AAA family ATPase n=1 Tax=Vibrio breoganii TaxID=553239 RepID=UPI000C81C1AB|nr:AAA family ATPase [Vibrio breoganii]PML10545.1 hypothetical protein BCT86_00830 [Vibrio breoganii]